LLTVDCRGVVMGAYGHYLDLCLAATLHKRSSEHTILCRTLPVEYSARTLHGQMIITKSIIYWAAWSDVGKGYLYLMWHSPLKRRIIECFANQDVQTLQNLASCYGLHPRTMHRAFRRLTSTPDVDSVAQKDNEAVESTPPPEQRGL